MVKYFLKDTDQEVKIGNKITISYPVRTPYGESKHEFDVLVTQESLKQLMKDNLVVAKEEVTLDLTDYKPFVKRLARKHNVSFNDALELLDNIKDLSIHAHNTLLLEMMAEVFNNGRPKGRAVFVINGNGVVAALADLGVCTPYFVSCEDAKKAAKLMKPFYEEARRTKQKD